MNKWIEDPITSVIDWFYNQGKIGRYIIDLLSKSFTGCNINRSWQPKALMSSRILLQKFVEEEGDKFNAKTKLMRAFFDEYQDVELKNKDIRKVLDVRKQNANRYLRLKK